MNLIVFFFQAEDGIRDKLVTGVQTCALPICHKGESRRCTSRRARAWCKWCSRDRRGPADDRHSRARPSLRAGRHCLRSEEHTSELQSLAYLVCRLLLEKKKKNNHVKQL